MRAKSSSASKSPGTGRPPNGRSKNSRTQTGPSPSGRTPQGRTYAGSRYRDNVARHLIGIARDLQSRVMRSLSEERGYRGLRPSLGPFLSLIWIEGRPLTAVASQQDAESDELVIEGGSQTTTFSKRPK